MVLLTSLSVMAQPTIVEPGDKSVDSSLLNIGKFTWGVRESGKAKTEAGESFITIQRNNKEITIETRETDKRGLDVGKRMIVLNAKTMEPIRSTYKSDEVSYNLQYGTKLKGSVEDYTTNKKNNIDEPMNGKFFDLDSLDFVISSLPLSLTYRVTLPIVRLNGGKPEFLRYQIADVVELRDHSCVSGVRDMWIVKAVDKKNNRYRFLNIDKQTRRILRSRIYSRDAEKLATDGIWDGDISWDKETDVNPIKTPFNTAEVRAMLTTGTSIIKGQAFTTDEAPKGVLQRSKKQFARKGSIVMLYPNTQYFKDWFNYNVGLQKLGTSYFPDQGYSCKVQLPPEVRNESLVTEVTDDKGSFVFQGLKPGEYIALVTFVATKYSHTTSTPNGYSVTVYPDGSATGGTTYDVRHWGAKENVLNYSYVTIKKDGETVKAKLDK